MYKATVRAVLRHAINRLNRGDPEAMLRLAAPDVELSFPGENSWSTMHRRTRKGRHAFVTHRGIAETRAFLERFVAEGLEVEVEDILVNGMPWNTRVALRAHDFAKSPDGGPDRYCNRFVDFIEIRWGRVRRLEVYEDSERVGAWDRATESEPALR